MKKLFLISTVALFVFSLGSCSTSDPMDEIEADYQLETPASEDDDDEHPKPCCN